MTVRPRITARTKARRIAITTGRTLHFTAEMLTTTILPAYLGAVQTIIATDYTDPGRDR